MPSLIDWFCHKNAYFRYHPSVHISMQLSLSFQCSFWLQFSSAIYVSLSRLPKRVAHVILPLTRVTFSFACQLYPSSLTKPSCRTHAFIDVTYPLRLFGSKFPSRCTALRAPSICVVSGAPRAGQYRYPRICPSQDCNLYPSLNHCHRRTHRWIWQRYLK